jgi:hypothetical protein
MSEEEEAGEVEAEGAEEGEEPNRPENAAGDRMGKEAGDKRGQDKEGARSMAGSMRDLTRRNSISARQALASATA